ncbi:MAG: hypothetical protein R6V30_10020 [Paracoccaceae bacterium]
MPPETTLLVVNAVFLAFAYGWVYPRLPEKTTSAIMAYDLAIGGAALLVAGLLYWGSGVAFSLILFDANWLFFSIITMAIMEVPLFLWLMKTYDIEL